LDARLLKDHAEGAIIRTVSSICQSGSGRN